MARKKVELQFITNYSKRRATFTKRKNGLKKKIAELSILCGIEACAVIFFPENPEPEIWPSVRGFQKAISRFRGMSQLEQNRKMLNQESFLKKSIIKSQDQLRKIQKENRKLEIGLHLSQFFFNGLNFFLNFNLIDLNDICYLVDQYLKEITAKINMLQVQEVAPVLQNGSDAIFQGQPALANHVQGSENYVSMNLNNGVGGPEMLPFDDVNFQSAWLNSFMP